MRRKLALVWLLSGLSLAVSPAEELYAQSTRALLDHYYGYSTEDLNSLIAQYQKRLEEVCKPQADACPVEVGRNNLEGVLARLGDPHTYYLRPEERVERERAQAGQGSLTPRIGVTTSRVPGSTDRVVLFVRDDGPAYRVGVRVGDRITQINGQPFPTDPDANASTIAEKSRSGQPFQMTMVRGNQTLSVTVQGEVLMHAPLPTLTTGAGLPSGVGLLQIPDFEAYQEVTHKVHQLVREAKQQKLHTLLLDLRNNEGGLLVEWVGAASAFAQNPAVLSVSKSEVSKVESRNGQLLQRINDRYVGTFYTLAAPELWEGKLALLVNRDTASSAEYFAYYLQQTRGIKVIGEPTAGLLNTATEPFMLPDSGALMITTVKAAGVDGALYPASVTPDILVEDDLSARAGTVLDPLVQKAVQELQLQLGM